MNEKEIKLCKHNGACLDRASSIHCAEWEINNCDRLVNQMNEKEIIRAFDEKFGSINQHGYHGVPINAEVSAYLLKSLSDQRKEIVREVKSLFERVEEREDRVEVSDVLSIINPE